MNPFAWAVTTIAFMCLWGGTYVLNRLLGIFGREPSGLELAPFYGFVVSVALPVSFRFFLERKFLSATWLIAFTPLLGLLSMFLAAFAAHNIPALQTRSEATQAAVFALVVFLPLLAINLYRLLCSSRKANREHT